MKYLRNKHTGKRLAYDEKLLELGYYEVENQSEESANNELIAHVADEIKSVAAAILKRKPGRPPKASGGINDDVQTGEEISIQLTRGE